MRLSHQIPALPAAARRARRAGTVIAPHDVAVEAGERMFALGGNAIDAAIAAALVSGVIEPAETTLAGSGFCLVGAEGSVTSVAFGPRAPRAARVDMFKIDERAGESNVLGLAPVVGNANIDGPLASGVPRTLLGLLTTHERWGALDRDVVLGPSIDAALGGFRADSWFLLNALSDLDRLGRDPMAARTFLENGLPRGRESQNYYGPSIDTARLVPQTALAQTLQLVAEEGLSALTTGTVARALVKTAQEQGLLLSLEDLALSAPQIGPAQSIAFRDSVVHIPAAPGGGLTELQILNIWQHLYPDDLPAYDNPDRLRMLTLAIRHAFADRYHWLGDPDVVDVPVEELLSETYAKDLAKLIRKDEVPVAFRDGTTPWSYFASRPLHLPRGGDAPSPWMPAGASTPTSGTTHISAADADGHFVSVTHTAANHFGSGIVCPRTGLLFDSAMAWFNARPGAANSIRPGARALANMGPVMLTRGGKPWAAIGASGGRRIISAVAQVVIGLVDFDMSPLTVLQQPRIDASGPVTVVHEHLADAMGALADLVPTIVPAGNDGFALDFGRANLVAMLPDGSLESAIDPNAYSR